MQVLRTEFLKFFPHSFALPMKIRSRNAFNAIWRWFGYSNLNRTRGWGVKPSNSLSSPFVWFYRNRKLITSVCICSPKYIPVKGVMQFKLFSIVARVFVEITENGGLYKKEHLMRAILFWGLLFILYVGRIFNITTSVLVSLSIYLCCGGWKFALLIYRTAVRDVRGLYRLTKMKMFIRRCRKKNSTVGDLFQRLVKKHPQKVCFLHDDEQWTFKDVENYSNQVANCFTDLGFSRGDNVALFMDGKPEFVAMWLGLSKIGVVPALVNTNLRLQPLCHSITVVNCKAIIFDGDFTSAIKDVAPLLKDTPSVQYFSLGKHKSEFPARPLDGLIQESSAARNPAQKDGNMDDHLFYVYTSGTTGLPKAAIIRHSRFMWLGTGIHYMSLLQDDDIIYTALPLYHTAGGILSMSQTLLFGITLAIRAKFSASKFWDDCIKYRATASQYIGEVCRYLLAQPVKPEETQHRVRMFFGNGLRPQIWPQFVERFGIKHIRELYGATEGNANVMNIDNKIGAVGFMSRIIPTVYPVTLIRVDPVSGEPIRDEKGLCKRCEPGEPGEFVGKIIVNDPLRSFDGYVNQSATKKKIIRDCFRRGDMAFLSGDLLTMDEDGYLFFMDRTGDTFRWRGENVSTLEVEGVISNILNLKDAVSYGVEVPDNEGRAGMVAVHDPEHTLDMNYLATEASKTLPPYAVPLFIRICDQLESTGTFKLKKVELQKEGFNFEKIKDPLYYFNKRLRTYSKLDAQAYHDICSGEIRL